MLRAIARLLKVLNSENEPGQISAALVFSIIAGLTPIMSLHNILVILLVTVLRVNMSAFILGLALFSAIGYILDPLFHGLGLAILTAPALEGLWNTLYGSALFRIERFNNSIVMGSLVFSLIISVPSFLGFNFLIRKYREHVLERVRKSGIMQAFMASKLYRTYKTVSGWGGAE